MGRPAPHATIEPRCLTREEAATYCGLTPEGFSAWSRQGIVPGPIPGTKRWDRKALDAALDAHSGLTPPESNDDDPFEVWKKQYDARKC